MSRAPVDLSFATSASASARRLAPRRVTEGWQLTNEWWTRHRRFAIRACALLVVTLASRALSAQGQQPASLQIFDVVILHGRVMDPESGLDAVRNIGIRGGSIRRLTTATLRGRETIEARGLVVAPGFIDLHQHAQDSAAYRVEVASGITTALELEDGVDDIDRWYAERAGRSPINYGAAIGHMWVRKREMRDSGAYAPLGDAARRAATPAERVAIAEGLTRGLQRGALAIGINLSYTPAATHQEVLDGFRVAAAAAAACHIHMRRVESETDLSDLDEVLADALISGAAAQIVHLNSSADSYAPLYAGLIRASRRRGVDVTTEMYPYSAAMSDIEGAGNDGWEQRPDDWFTRFEWPPTGERLTRATFAAARLRGGLVVMHKKDEPASEQMLHALVRDSLVMIASDGILSGDVGHPRVAGSFARILGRYVRESHDLSLMEALRRMTLAPAQRMERRAPLFRQKGRIRPGADADLVLFDAATVIDRATYRQPTIPPAGMPFVLVGGTVVVRNGERQPVAPGRPMRAPLPSGRGA